VGKCGGSEKEAVPTGSNVWNLRASSRPRLGRRFTTEIARTPGIPHEQINDSTPYLAQLLTSP
jgi:hypothetical protein